MSKKPTNNPVRQSRRHNPLEHDILATGILRQKAAKRKSQALEDDGNGYVESTQSKKILRLGRELVEEDEAANPPPPRTSYDAFALSSRPDQADTQDEKADGEKTNGENVEDDEWEDEEEEVEVDDRDTFNRFLPHDLDQDPLLKYGWDLSGPAVEEQTEQPVNLADVILAKISEFEWTKKGGNMPAPDEVEFPPKVIEVYTKVGILLQRYKSGKLPKPVKILPTVPNWEELLQYMDPAQWTPNACFAVTKVFASAKPSIAQRWMELVMLERVQEDIYENKKLNVHLWEALKKSLYKPSAFFKGFLFPLVDSGTCTLRVAHIITGVLVRTSIPVLHSAAAIKGLCDIASEQSLVGTEGGHATDVFIQALLEKRYALPYQVIDALVFHFLRYRTVDTSMKDDAAENKSNPAAKPLPLSWHRCFLAFAQRYKNDITEDQREALLDLLLIHGHSGVAPDIRRELLAGRGRGVVKEPEGPGFDGDDTMVIDS